MMYDVKKLMNQCSVRGSSISHWLSNIANGGGVTRPQIIYDLRLTYTFYKYVTYSRT